MFGAGMKPSDAGRPLQHGSALAFLLLLLLVVTVAVITTLLVRRRRSTHSQPNPPGAGPTEPPRR